MLKRQLTTWLIAGAMGLTFASRTLSAQETTDAGAATPTKVGSGDRYQTTVTSKSKGELKPEDARQVSLLGSRILAHVHNASSFLAEEKRAEAQRELENAQKLAGVVREMLPVTVVTTTTTDAQGTEVYRYEDRIQEDQIPVVEGMINVEVVQPIIEARKEEAAVKGVQLADADLIRTSMTMNLDYVEGKIRQALVKLNEPEKARTDLLAASAIGVSFSAEKEDHPLVNVQAALRLAEKQVREGKHDGAKANLQLARIQLDAYRTLVGDAAGSSVQELEKEIGALQEKTREPGTADKIRDFWGRVTGLFKDEPETASKSSPERQARKG